MIHLRSSISTVMLVCFGMFCCGPAAPARADFDATPLRILVEEDRPPFAFRTPTGVLAGFDVSIAGSICREMQRPCMVTSRALPAALEDLKRGDVDMIVAGLVPSPQLRASFDFSERYYRAGSVFVGRKGTGSLARARFGALADSPQMDYLRARPDILSIKGSSSQNVLWIMLETGSVDAVLVDNLLAFAFLLSPVGAAYDTIGPSLSPEIVPGTHHVAVRKGDARLLEAVNRALEGLRRDGQFLALGYKYFTLDID